MFKIFWKDFTIECDTAEAVHAVLKSVSEQQLREQGQQIIADAISSTARLTVRSLKIGDCFCWKDAPKGWSFPARLIVTDGPPGYALPEGWDFFDINVLDNEIEIIRDDLLGDDKPTIDMQQMQLEANQKPRCQYCGVMLIEGPTQLDKERYQARVCGGCQ